MSNSSERVAAVIVTYNKLDYLRRSLPAVLAQTRKPELVIVVDNASSDGTQEWLQQQSGVNSLRMTSNTGSSGGFAAGIEHAYSQGADWIWVMDDDCIPSPTALEKLVDVARVRPDAAFLSSLVLWKDGTPCRMNIPHTAWEWTDHVQDKNAIFPITACSFVSFFVNAAYVGSVGLPVRPFFIWYDDFEYSQRLAAAGPGYFVPQSIVLHDTAENSGVDWSRVTKAALGKYGNGLRNELALIAHNQPNGYLRALLRGLEIHRTLRNAGVDRSLQLQLLRKAIEGIRWDYRKSIQLPSAPNVQPLHFSKGEVPFVRYAGKDWNAVYGTACGIQTHPPERGEASSNAAAVTFRAVSLPAGATQFESLVRVPDKRAAEVAFCVDVLQGGRVVHTESIRTAAAENAKRFTFSLRAEGRVDVRLYAVMARDTDEHAHAASVWINPRLVTDRVSDAVGRAA